MKSSKKSKKLVINNKLLAEEFEHLNSRFFGGMLSNVTVRFAAMKPQGQWDYRNRRIRINKKLIPTGTDYIYVTLLHEMAHAYLETIEHYKGYRADAGHGTQFQGEIVRLMKAGAYDGLL